MTFRVFLLWVALCTLLSWLAWVFVVWRLDPAQGKAVPFIVFYVTLAMAVFGTAVLGGALVRRARSRDVIVSRLVIQSIRQAAFLSLLVVGAFLLSSLGLLRLYTLMPLLVFFVLLEMFFSTRTHKPDAPLPEQDVE